MKLVIGIIFIYFSTALCAGDYSHYYNSSFESKRKQFQKSINSSEMQKNVDDWNKFVETELSRHLKLYEKDVTIQELHKKWLVLRSDYWKALDLKYKKNIGSSSSIDHVRAQLEFTSNYLKSLILLND